MEDLSLSMYMAVLCLRIETYGQKNFSELQQSVLKQKKNLYLNTIFIVIFPLIGLMKLFVLFYSLFKQYQVLNCSQTNQILCKFKYMSKKV